MQQGAQEEMNVLARASAPADFRAVRFALRSAP